ncbi:MAG: rod shape-determining protein MreD, partial [Actinomycetota bacterium]|nr:rod shape-determining protein MreD [Actinomycetota bacterium]
MILTPWINVRLGAIVLAAVLLQVTFFSYLSIFGASPDFVVVVVSVVGLLGGAVIGAVVGFAAGLLLDVSLLETLGASSLVLLSAGYLAGRYRESFEIDSAFAPAAVTGALALLASAGLTALQLTLEVDSSVSGAVVADSIVKGFLAFLLTYPIYPLIRLALRPALVLEGAPARRSARTAPAARPPGR